MKNIRRVSEVAKLMNDAGLIVLVSFISPFREERRKAREIIGEPFVEVYVSTSLEECERRDVKGCTKRREVEKFLNFRAFPVRMSRRSIRKLSWIQPIEV